MSVRSQRGWSRVQGSEQRVRERRPGVEGAWNASEDLAFALGWVSRTEVTMTVMT